MSEQHVIIGGGQAAAQAAQTLRQSAPEARIVVVGEEPELPYQRPPLSKKYLAGELPRERLALRPESFYAERRIELELGRRVVAIDRGAQRLALDDGRELAYDRLLLATGSRARTLPVPGADLPGVHRLRTVADVDRIRAELATAQHVVLVGAGYIGLEAAAVLVEHGLHVAVLESADRPLGRVVCREVAQFYHERHTRAGVELHYGAAVVAFDGGERVAAALTADGRRFRCDLAIIGIGVEPNVELARDAGLDCADGIAVDDCARTADPNVFAAGDCASRPGPLGRVRLESVPNAIHQAKIAALGMAGQPTPYSEVPWFWSDQFELKLQIAGLRAGYERIVLRGAPSADGFAAYYLRGGRVLAVEAVNSPRDFVHGKKLIASGAEVPVDALADPAADLAAFGG